MAENKANEFYNQISIIFAGLILTFVISSIIVTCRTHQLDVKANKIWKNIVYSEVKDIQYKHLVECAYIGGTKYENLLLNNPQFLKIVKNNEQDILSEQDWEDKRWRNTINNKYGK